jgi:hypothetical protein
MSWYDRDREDQQKAADARAQEQRQKVIAYKNFFDTDSGKVVLSDLMNRFHMLNPLPDTNVYRAEGSREVVLYILKQTNTDVKRLDKILKGDFT